MCCFPLKSDFFALFWVGMISLMSVVFSLGDANKIFHGVDYMGNTCGHSANTSSRPKIYYPRIAEDILETLAQLSPERLKSRFVQARRYRAARVYQLTPTPAVSEKLECPLAMVVFA